MNKHIKLIPWIAAIALGISLASPVNAQERGNRGYNNDRGAEVVVGGPRYGYQEYAFRDQRGRDNRTYYAQNRGNRYAYGRPYFAKQNFRKMKKRKQMKRMRRIRNMNRVYNQPRYDRPVIIIPLPGIFR